jgi:hypothetical protein
LGGKGINIPLIPTFAKGTGYTPDTFIAGEEGPELIAGAKGRMVLTNRKTNKLLGDSGLIENGIVRIDDDGLIDALQAFCLSAATLARSATAASATVAAACGIASNRSMTQNIEIINTFNGDRAGQKQSASAMSSAAKDTTSELARGLAYAR